MFLISNRSTGRSCVVSASSMDEACNAYGIEPDNDYPNNADLVKSFLKDEP